MGPLPSEVRPGRRSSRRRRKSSLRVGRSHGGLAVSRYLAGEGGRGSTYKYDRTHRGHDGCLPKHGLSSLLVVPRLGSSDGYPPFVGGKVEEKTMLRISVGVNREARCSRIWARASTRYEAFGTPGRVSPFPPVQGDTNSRARRWGSLQHLRCYQLVLSCCFRRSLVDTRKQTQKVNWCCGPASGCATPTSTSSREVVFMKSTRTSQNARDVRSAESVRRLRRSRAGCPGSPRASRGLARPG